MHRVYFIMKYQDIIEQVISENPDAMRKRRKRDLSYFETLLNQSKINSLFTDVPKIAIPTMVIYNL